jgi:hypothetical protein
MSLRRLPEDELLAALEAMLAGVGQRNAGAVQAHRPMALGWATVELDRAARELTRRIPSTGPFEPSPGELLLGARCLVGAPVALPARDAISLRLVLLEPSTEGRLAATLARLGEGPAAIWLELDELPDAPLSRPTEGPFGRERLLLGGPVHGPHRLVVVG